MTELSEAKRALLTQRLRRRVDVPSIPVRPEGAPAPLSYAQERLWFMDRYTPGNPAYVIPISRRIRGPVDGLADALARLAARHEPLRTRFPASEDGKPVAVIDEMAVLPLATAAASGEEEARELVEAFLVRPFDLAAEPPCRALLVELAPDDHVLALALHHIAGDGWSSEVLLRELLDDGPAPGLPVSYGDYAIWQRDRDDSADLAYWVRQMDGVEPLDLPADRPRPPELTYEGAAHGFRIDAGLLEGYDATPYMVLLAAFAALLGRYTGRDDVTVGSPVAGRSRPELENLVGCFVNTLPMRVDLSGAPSFAELVRRVRDTSLDAFTHQDLPFERLVAELDVERDVSRSPVFQVLFAMQNYGGTRREDFGLRSWRTRYDLELYAGEGSGMFIYNTALFDPDTIERLAGHLVALLRSEPLAERPEPAEPVPFPDDTTVHALIEDQVARAPDAIAVTFEGESLTYAELNARANRVAHSLRGRGIGPGALVAVRQERSFELVATLLGVLKSGAAYVPLDPDYPADRLAFMIEDSGAIDPVVDPDAPEHDPEPVGGPDDVAYMIYTSGSTGRPKGVPNTHRALCNRLAWMELSGDDVVVQKTPASFDVSVWEFFLPLLRGARLVLAAPGGHKDPGYLRELIAAESVTVAHFVPSMLAMFLGEPAAPSLRRIICSGEELPADLARRCLAAYPELLNLYGPTEAAIDVSAWRCTADDGARVPIGTPVANTALYVLDQRLAPAPVGVPGELYIGGVQVARGYHARPGLTAERFVADPFAPGRMYRTGDLARRRADGALEFLGRVDQQVKLRGMRIEPGEIEAALRARPGVRDAAVIMREDRPGDQRLVAYVTGAEPDPAALRDALPEHMIPSAVVLLDALPLSPGGKLDRRALPAPTVTTTSAEPETPTELLVARVWADVLGLDRVGADDDFFQLGGHSLLVIQVIAKLRAGVGVMDVFKNPTVRRLAALIDTPESDRAPRGLLHELTSTRTATVSYVCVPYGGGSAAVYQPLADALPATCALWSVAIPGHDIGLDEEPLNFDELAARCVAEVQEKVRGPIRLYGHCGVGSALIVDIARRLEAAGREIETVFIGAIFPFARPGRRWLRLSALRGDQHSANWLTSMGVDMSGMEPAQARRIIRNMRRDSEAAEEYFTGLFKASARLNAPIVTVAGDRDPATEYYPERFREWHFLTGETSVVVLAEAGHFFLKYRAEELADIITGAEEGPHWRRYATSTSPASRSGPEPSVRRFLGVAAGQLVSILGSALTEFAIPIWIYLTTGSLARFALFSVVGLVPGMLVAPLAGAIVDRSSRRAVMLAGDVAAASTQLILGILLWTGDLHVWEIYPLLGCLSVALTFQRLAYGSAVPQLVPKRYLGHANGIVQMAGGLTQLLVPIFAVGLMAAIGLGGILVLDLVSYAFAITVTALVRFPRTMAWRRKEPVLTEMMAGFRYSWGEPGFRRMLLFFAGLNVFLSPLFLMISPLVLSFATLRDVGTVSFAAGLGVFTGGLAMTVWGGPRHHRMRGVLLCTLALAACCLVTGLRANLAVIAAGAFGMSLCLTVLNGVYTTIVQVKVAQRFHGRVFALNTLIAWSTLPLGFGLIAPYGTRLFHHFGYGIGTMYAVFAACIAAVALLALRSRLSRFDDEVPDAESDDLLGLKALRGDETAAR